MRRAGPLAFFPVFTLLGILIVTVIWHQKLRIVEFALETLTPTGQIDNLDVVPSRLSVEGLAFKQLSFDLAMGSRNIQVVCRDAELRLDYPDSLLPRSASLVINQLRLSEKATTEDTPADSDNFTVRQLVTSLQGLITGSSLPPLPLSRIQIDDISLVINKMPVVENASFELDADPDSLNATLGHQDYRLRWQQDQNGLQLGMASHGEQLPLLQIEMAAAENSISISGDVETAQIRPWLDQYAPSASMPGYLNQLSGSVQFQLNMAIQADTIPMQLSLSADQISFGPHHLAEPRLQLNQTLSAAEPLAIPQQWNLTGSDSLRLEKYQGNSVTLGPSHLQPAGTIQYDNGELSAHLDSGSTLSVASFTSDSVSLQSLMADLNIDFRSGELQFNPGTKFSVGQVASSNVLLDDLQLQPVTSASLEFNQQETMQILQSRWLMSTSATLDPSLRIRSAFEIDLKNLTTENLSANLLLLNPIIDYEQPVPAIERLEVSLNRADYQWTATGRLNLKHQSIPLRYKAFHRSDIDQGKASLWTDAKIPATQAFTLAQKLLEKIPRDIGVTSGDVGLTFIAEWQEKKITAEIDLELEAIDGSYDDSAFSGLNLTGKWNLLPKLSSNGPAKLRLKQLQYGILVEKIAADLQLVASETGPLPEFHVEWIKGELLGAVVSNQGFNLNPNNPDTIVIVDVYGLDIEQVVATQNVDELIASGRVDGRLPLRISPEGISIENGSFHNQRDGRINYNISEQQAAALDNPLTDVVIQALRDFHYEILSADTSFHPDGTLKIDFHLEGVSPGLDSNRKVHLNIHSEQNVLSLLRSLNYTDGLNSALDKQIQEKYQ